MPPRAAPPTSGQQQQHGSGSCSPRRAAPLCPLHGDEAATLQPYLPAEALIPAAHASSAHAAQAATAMRDSSRAQALLKLLCQMRSGVADGKLLLPLQRPAAALQAQPALADWKAATIQALVVWLSQHAPSAAPLGGRPSAEAVHDAVASVLTNASARSEMLEEVKHLWLTCLHAAAGVPFVPPPLPLPLPQGDASHMPSQTFPGGAGDSFGSLALASSAAAGVPFVPLPLPLPLPQGAASHMPSQTFPGGAGDSFGSVVLASSAAAGVPFVPPPLPLPLPQGAAGQAPF